MDTSTKYHRRRASVAARPVILLLAVLGMAMLLSWKDHGGPDSYNKQDNSNIMCGKLQEIWTSMSHPALTLLPEEDDTLRALPIFTGVFGHCDLLGKNGCDQIESGFMDDPDLWITEFIQQTMEDCHEKECHSIDIGSNLGIISLRLLQTGATVTSFEPQIDLCCASQQSAVFNQLDRRYNVQCGAVTESSLKGNQTDFPVTVNWRNGDSPVNEFYNMLSQKLRLPAVVPLFDVKDVVVPGRHYEFIKVDTDSIDCTLVAAFLDLQRKGVITFGSIAFETWSCSNELFSSLLADLQTDGYKVLLAPAHVGPRPPRPFPTQDVESIISHVHTLKATTLFELKTLNKFQWNSEPKGWKQTFQMLAVSNEVPFSDLTVSHK